MALDERARHRLRQHLDEALGADTAETVMTELLGPERDELALRSDVEGVRSDVQAVRREVEGLRSELYQRLHEQTRYLTFWMLGAVLAVASLAFGTGGLG